MCLESGGSFRKSQREEGIQEEAGIRAKQEERQRGQLPPLSPWFSESFPRWGEMVNDQQGRLPVPLPLR